MLDLESEIKINVNKHQEAKAKSSKESKKSKKSKETKLLKYPPIKFKNDKSYAWKDLLTEFINNLDKETSYTVIDVYGQSGYLCYLWKALRNEDRVIYNDISSNYSKIASKDPSFLMNVEIISCEDVEKINEEIDEDDVKNIIYIIYNLDYELSVFSFLSKSKDVKIIFFDNSSTCDYINCYNSISKYLKQDDQILELNENNLKFINEFDKVFIS